MRSNINQHVYWQCMLSQRKMESIDWSLTVILLVKTLNSMHVSARDLAKVAGQCISMTKAIVPGKMLLCNIYLIITSCTDWEDKHLLLLEEVFKDLKWWLNVTGPPGALLFDRDQRLH